MLEQTHFHSYDNKVLSVERWTIDDPTGVVCICHGMAEYAARYERFAKFLNSQGLDVWSYDQRGHGNHLSPEDTVGYVAKENGWSILVKDLESFIGFVQKIYSSLPTTLLGHSMGSLVALNCMQKCKPNVQGLVLSSFPENPGLLRDVGAIIASIQKAFAGGTSLAKIHTALSFGAYNKAYKPNRTDFDWISRDELEVNKYVNDPLCGATFTASFFSNLLEGVKSTHNRSMMTAMNRDVPVYMFCGSEDPVVGLAKGFDKSAAKVRTVMRDVQTKTYQGGRHEMLNETNRDEVSTDIATWIKTKTC